MDIVEEEVERTSTTLTTPFTAGLMMGPVLEAYATLSEFYKMKREIAAILEELSPLSFEALLQQIPSPPTLPASPHDLRISYLLMHDLVEVVPVQGKGPLAEASSFLRQYFKSKDYVIRFLLELADSALFAVVDMVGADLSLCDPYVQINGVKYENKTEVIYYLVVLRSYGAL